MAQNIKKPDWIKKKIFYSKNNHHTQSLLKNGMIHTVCEEARCPNRSECFDDKTATFLILGNICTRNCKFCSVENVSSNNHDKLVVDPDEPNRISKIVSELKLNYVVITSVTRDDLEDGGATQFVETILAIKKNDEKIKTEVLTPDFQYKKESINKIVDAKPDVYNHNLETVERLTPLIRNKANYKTSLSVLEQVKVRDNKMITKSGIMLGCGEEEQELYQLFKDLNSVGCDILTIGQYLQPTKKNIEVQKYYTENQFDYYKNMALECGIQIVFSAPFVRSSYRAYQNLFELKNK